MSDDKKKPDDSSARKQDLIEKGGYSGGGQLRDFVAPTEASGVPVTQPAAANPTPSGQPQQAANESSNSSGAGREKEFGATPSSDKK